MGDPGQDGAGPARRPVRRALGAARRLLRLPTQSARSHEQLLDVLDELRSTLAGLEVQSAGVRAQLDQVRSEAEGVHALAATTHAEALAARKLLEGLDPPARPEMVEEVGRRLDDLTTSVRGIVGELRQSLDEQAGRARLLAATTAAVADHVAVGDGWTIEEGPLVSVVVPVRNRHDVLPGALASLRAQTYGCWECLLVDDGSTEPFDDALVEGDARVRVLRTPASGVAAARNAALAEATGELVAFLDSDNEWYPSRLARVVGAMAATPSVGWAVDGQLVDDVGGFPHVRDMRRPLAALDHRNLFDIGSVVVRRRLLDVVGGFDPGLPRLSDWDLIRRLAAVEAPLRLPSIGSRYHDQADDRISVTEPYGPSWYEVRRRAIGRPAEGLRVLVAEWHYPQLTEVYMEAELVALSRLGAHVEAWSDDEVAVRFSPSVPVHRGALADAVAAVRPHVVLSHWLHVGHRYREVTARAGVPHVVRGHGFDFDPAVVDDLLRDRGVVVHLFPHLAQQWSWHPRVTTHPVAIDGRRYPPNRDKDRTLVVRLAAGLITKDMDVFFEAAKRCPDHRFVLGLGHVYNAEGLTEELARRAVELDAPVEVLVDLDFEQAASLVGRAGTYVHTHGTDHPVGMPTSIAEAMATGAYVLARDLPGARAFLGRAGATYAGGSVEERADRVAALVNATTRWDDARWASTWTAAVDQAWTRFPAELVVAAMVEEWRALLGVGRR